MSLQRMSHSKLLLASFLCFLFILPGLAACGKQPGQTGSSGQTTLKLIMHTNAPAVQAIKDLDNAFHQKYPDITVSVTTANSNDFSTLQTTRLSAKDVDIVEEPMALVGAPASYMPSTAEKPSWQQQIDAGDYVDLTGQPFLKNFYQSALQNADTYKGKVWGVPSGAVAYTGIFYSKDVFQKYHLQIPTTWNQLVSLCQTLQSHGVTPFTIGQKDSWPAGLPTSALTMSLNSNLQTLDQGLWTGKIKYTDPKEVEVLKRAQVLWGYTEKGFGGIDYSTITARFAAGKAAMLPDGTWQAPSIQQADPNFQFGYFPLPGSDNASDNDFLGGKYDLSWGIASSSSHKDAAMKWLAFYSDPANYSKFINAVGFIPTQPNVTTTPFLQSISQWTTDKFRLANDQVMHPKAQAGKYATFATMYLSPLGSFHDPVALAQQEQKDWDAAKQ
ncbi:ABC transporter substrate-binding protein [Dictyobacter formicarum]|uniref:Sugar ABC transporter substrate-binding protein n=1 Tax=Dictyobacter formicarum TaxID=2778368 RepID=A0ABQ3VGC9_9CHLR|nr:extracellular solute-binding protein [Dictyobacter formicarum]GHO84759.1 hypothetical protein KSZ_27650 [Dictyobacter formicarum]